MLPTTRGKKLRGQNGQVLRGPSGPRGGLGKEKYEFEAGTMKNVDVLDNKTGGLDGKLYADMMIGEGDYAGTSILSQIQAYGGQEEIQEDGAPGHGYANKKKGKPPTEEHERFVTEAQRMRIRVSKQAALSPETNDVDLGMWYSCDSGVRRRANEFKHRMTKKEQLDLLYEIIEEEFMNMDPAGLYSIAEHKVDICRQIVARNGKKVKKEDHGGARRRTRQAIAAAKAQDKHQ